MITSAILGFIAQKGLSLEVLPLTILLTILGLYGAVTSEKLYETFKFHIEHGKFILEKIDQLQPNSKIIELMNNAKKSHRLRFKRLWRLRLHHLWLTLHISIAISGILLSVIPPGLTHYASTVR